MARQKREKVDRNLTYEEIVERLGEDEDVSFERIGDTIILRRKEPEEVPEPQPELPVEFKKELDEAERKLLLVKREIEKRKVGKIVKKDYQELDAAFARMEERLIALEKELRGLRVELGYLRGVVYDKMKAEKVEEPKVKEVAVGEEKQLQLVQDDIPEIKFEETKIGGLGLLASTLSNIYNSLFLGAQEERDVYKEFQKKLFLLVRSQPRSLDEIAEGTGENKANCLIWLTRMVDEGLLEEVKGAEGYGKRIYRIVWEKVQ
ncbi:MAG: hypothetical protein QXF56_00790 [Candidatus Micrarchaeia archaeon]